jgi:ketosteroid isomerase-like protein
MAGTGDLGGADVAGDGIQNAVHDTGLDATYTNGRRLRLDEVSVRTWRDGKIVKERFYYKP